MAANSKRAGRLVAVMAAMTVVGWLADGHHAVAADGAGDKVRGTDSRARAVISRAAQASPTIAALLVALNATDVVVMVQVTLMPVPLGGDMRMLAATATCRYLAVRLDARRSPGEQMEFLGHELQHAKEVAEAKDVRDEEGLARLMARIGRKTGNGTFETDAAVQVGRLVRREITQGARF